MAKKQANFHGDPARFESVARFIGDRFIGRVRYVADVAGGQGMLSRILSKKYNLETEVIDPRGHSLRGVTNRAACFFPEDAAYYDLIVGVHPDAALRPIVEASLVRPTLVVPCCNFWASERLAIGVMLDSIERWYVDHKVHYEKVEFSFTGPRVGFVTGG